MKKRLTLFLFTLFLASIFIFTTFGNTIREILSPNVLCVYPEYRTFNETDGRMYLSFPVSALQTDENGLTYIYTVVKSNEYNEEIYCIQRQDVKAVHKTDRSVYVQFTNIRISDAVVVGWDEMLYDGQQVHIQFQE